MDNVIQSKHQSIYDRQKNMGIEVGQDAIIVVGVGGIGSWVAFNAALMGVGIIMLYDDDKIELSNLNRTPFTQKQVGMGMNKAVAMEELIMERRSSTVVTVVKERATNEDILEQQKGGIKWVFDCSDTNTLRDAVGQNKAIPKSSRSLNYIKLGYDGFKGTICWNNFTAGAWTSDSNYNSYAYIPSFLGTPQVIAMIILCEVFIVNRISGSHLIDSSCNLKLLAIGQSIYDAHRKEYASDKKKKSPSSPSSPSSSDRIHEAIRDTNF
jgi:hypothetical protein